MHVIALVFLALALAASSSPLPPRSNGVSASQDGPYTDITPVGARGDHAIYAPGSGIASGSEARSSGTYSPNDNGSGDIHMAGSSTTVSSPRSGSFDRRHTTGSVWGLAATNPTTHNTLLRSRHVFGSGFGSGNVAGRVVALVATTTEMGGRARKFVRRKCGIHSSAEGAAAKGATGGGAIGSLAGSGSSIQAGGTST